MQTPKFSGIKAVRLLVEDCDACGARQETLFPDYFPDIPRLHVEICNPPVRAPNLRLSICEVCQSRRAQVNENPT